MVKLRFCVETDYLSGLWNSNQQREAVRAVAKKLRSNDELSPSYRELVASMLESIFKDKTSRSKKVKSENKPGPQKALLPKNFAEIGFDYEDLISDGRKVGEAEKILTEKYGMSVRTIQYRLAKFKRAKDKF
jgi:NADH:ubiquinone oxidoreductase subunit F (NADH-binding)